MIPIPEKTGTGNRQKQQKCDLNRRFDRWNYHLFRLSPVPQTRLGSVTMLDVVLLVHVVSGTMALSSAIWAISSKKGKKSHRRVGRVFFWSMVGVAATAIPVTFVNPNPFLFFIALFSAYMAYAGYRRGKASYEHKPSDNWAAVGMFISAILMVGFGLLMIIGGNGLGWALIAFGFLGGTFGAQDFLISQKSQSHLEKVKVHLARMLGGTIATVTALLVQQVSPLLDSQISQVLMWLAPTIILTPLIAIWSARLSVTKKYGLFAKTTS